MRPSATSSHHRRAFLRFLAGSPYVAALGGIRAFAQRAPELAAVIGDPKEAFNVMDFEEAAHRKVQPGHWAYMASGVDDDLTLKANREGYLHIQLRPRRLHDATKVDTRTDLFGTVYNSPIYTCPPAARVRSIPMANWLWRARRRRAAQSGSFDSVFHRRGGRERRAWTACMVSAVRAE